MDHQALAARLDQAWDDHKPITPLSDAEGLSDVADAYAIQTAWTELRVQRGDTILGRKIGLTSKAMREAAGIHEPDFGTLWSSRFIPANNNAAELPHATFIQPRIEGEIAFLLAADLHGPGVGVDDVLAATEAIAPSFEVVDSRIIRNEFRLVDTVADNASYGAFTVGDWSRELVAQDMRTLGMLLSCNGDVQVEGVGYASLGHPAAAVAWLANKLAAFDIILRAGDIVLSGSLGAALPIAAGDEWVMELHGAAPLTMRFTRD